MKWMVLMLSCLAFVNYVGAAIKVNSPIFPKIEQYRRVHRELLISNWRNPGEYDTLRNLLGNPKEDPITARALRGNKRTTKLHKLCERRHGLNDEWSEDRTAYDKMICGLFTKKDMYKKHEQRVVQILTRKNSPRSLDKQKSELIQAVNLMAEMAGPLPTLTFSDR